MVENTDFQLKKINARNRKQKKNGSGDVRLITRR